MRSIARILLVGAVAVMAIAVSAAPSEAAKKKRMKSMAPGTSFGQLCTVPSVTANVGIVMVWGYGNKWHRGVLAPTCLQPWCPAACK